MSDMSDLAPMRDARYDLGTSLLKWYALFVTRLSDGVVDLAVADLATKDDYDLMSKLPVVSADDEGKFLTVYNGRFELSPAPPGVLPPVSATQNGMYLVSRNGSWIAAYMPVLPVVSVDDNGDIMKVVDGVWRQVDPPISLPPVSVMDNGKILSVYLGRWQAVAPPTDVLPVISEGDHGSILQIENYEWTKWHLGRATMVSDGLVPKLPGISGRVLMGDNTWGAAPSGSSGQWRVGDIRVTKRPVEYGFKDISSGLTITPAADDDMKALYLAVGMTEADWAANTPLVIPAAADSQIRYLPDTQASVDFGIVMEVPSGAAGTKAHIELELYRNPADIDHVLMVNTYFKMSTSYEFTAGGIPYHTSAPGFFVRQDDLLWRLFDSGGETIPADGIIHVLFDTGEACLGEGINKIVTPGGYYYRWRAAYDDGTYTDWKWNRILTTGGLNREEAQVLKLCDVFACGRVQSWKSPAVAVAMYAVSEAGLEETYADENDRVAIGTRLRVGTRIAVVGHGNIKMTGDADRMDMFATMPQYTAVEMVDSPPVVLPKKGFGTEPLSNLMGYCCLETGISKFILNKGTVGAFHIEMKHSDLTITMEDDNSGRGIINNNYHFFYGKVDGKEYPIMVPDRQAGIYYDNGSTRSCFSKLWKTIPESAGVAEWKYPYFTSGHFINDRSFLMPGEAPGVWDCDTETLIPIPDGTIFKGSPASALGPDGCIYCMPRFTNSEIATTRSTGMMRFDPFTREITFIDVPWELAVIKTDNWGWYNAITLKDGRILFVPYGEDNFVIYDVRYQSLTRTNFGAVVPEGFKWANAAVCNDGTVIGIGTDIPGRGSLCFRFSPDTTSLDVFTFATPISRSLRALTALPTGSLMGAAFELMANNVQYFKIDAGLPKYVPGTFSPIANKR